MKPEPLRCFNPNLPFKVTYRHLPHWEQTGVCAFVTMRLGDSIPVSVHQMYCENKKRWCRVYRLEERAPTSLLLQRMNPYDARRFQRMGSRLYQHALDKGSGECVFKHPEVRKIFWQALMKGRESFFTLGAGVIMPNHVHLLIQPVEEVSLAKILSSLRRCTARDINRALHRRGELWQPEPFDHLIRSRGKYEKFKKYILLNPVRPRLRPDEFLAWEGDL